MPRRLSPRLSVAGDRLGHIFGDVPFDIADVGYGGLTRFADASCDDGIHDFAVSCV
jgi:hypothetical protein